MARKIYYPSCRLKATLPEAAQAASDYMLNSQGAVLGNCCRDEAPKTQPDDTAVYNCNTCAILLSEWSNAQGLISIYELIDADSSFVFPDYKGREMAVQDCWRSHKRPDMHRAIRSLASKMNITVVELQERGENSVFCGETTMKPLPLHYVTYAPKWFGADLPEWACKELPEDVRESKMRAHADSIPTSDVICNCLGCISGIAKGGKKPHHILELVFL